MWFSNFTDDDTKNLKNMLMEKFLVNKTILKKLKVYNKTFKDCLFDLFRQACAPVEDVVDSADSAKEGGSA